MSLYERIYNRHTLGDPVRGMREYIESVAGAEKREATFAFNNRLIRVLPDWIDFLFSAFQSYVKLFHPRTYGPTLASFRRWYQSEYGKMGSQSPEWSLDEREQWP